MVYTEHRLRGCGLCAPPNIFTAETVDVVTQLHLRESSPVSSAGLGSIFLFNVYLCQSLNNTKKGVDHARRRNVEGTEKG